MQNMQEAAGAAALYTTIASAPDERVRKLRNARGPGYVYWSTSDT